MALQQPRESRRMAGTCVIDLASYVLQDPWQEIKATFQVPLPEGGRPLRAEAAKDAMARMAGVPTKSLERMVKDWDISMPAIEAVRAARSAGITSVLALAAPQAVVEGLAHRMGGVASAALTPEVVMGRLTGELIQPSWAGPCGDAVCLGEVARAAREDFGGPSWIVSTARGCPCTSGRIVDTGTFHEQISVAA